MANIDQEQRILRPELVTEPDGTEWVQIVDEYGFAGYDPTDEQIAEGALAAIDKNIPTKDTRRLGDIAVNTTLMNIELLRLAKAEISGRDVPLHLRCGPFRNRDIIAAGKRVLLHAPGWRDDIRRTTDEQPQGEQ